MIETKKVTAPFSSVGADGVQPQEKNFIEIITNPQKQINLQATNFNDFHTISPEKSGQDGLQVVSMTELYDTAYPSRILIIDGILYGGTYLFVGAPKVGKSFFMAQLAYHVAMGIPLWEYPVYQGTVLYLALEDDYARLQRRLSRMFGIESADHFYLSVRAKSLSEGLCEQLENFVKAHKNTKLMIIDTLQKVREASGDRYSYSIDYEIVTKLKAFSDTYGVCLLLVHHTRKLESEDSFEMISGTNGLLGAADGAFIMQKKKRTDNIAVLDIVGRDQPDQELTIEFERETCIWKFKKAETELWKQPPDPLLETIAKLISSEQPEWSGTASELIKILQLEIQPNILTRKLNISMERLSVEYGIYYESSRGHNGRKITLKLQTKSLEKEISL